MFKGVDQYGPRIVYIGQMGETKPVAELLRELRTAEGISLRRAAADLEIDASYLSKLERGEKPLPDEFQSRAADYYSVDPLRLAHANGQLPSDVLRIFADHPEAIDELRKKYGSR